MVQAKKTEDLWLLFTPTKVSEREERLEGL